MTEETKVEPKEFKAPENWTGRISLFALGFASSLGAALSMMPGGEALLLSQIKDIPLIAWLFAIVGGLTGGASPEKIKQFLGK